MSKKNKNWIKPRHLVVRNVAYVLLYPYIKLKYRIKVDKFKEQRDTPYLILLNHQTPFDQFFCGMSFKGRIYYLATEDIFSKGWISSIIRWLIAPIPIKKQATDINAVKNCIKVAKEGGTIAIAPEGNRTYSGKTEYMNPTIAPLARKLGLPIVLYRIEGGYGVQPRWTDATRRGKMHSYVYRVIEPEEYAEMTNDELMAAIEEGLYVNEAVADGIFKSNKRAEYLERAIYVCPFCGFAHHESKGNEIRCKKCSRTVTYGEDKRLKGNGFDFPFEFVNDWYEYQSEFVNGLDVTAMTDSPVFEDTADMFEVIVYKNKNIVLENADIRLYGNRMVVNEGKADEVAFIFDEVFTMAVLGRNKLNVYQGKQIFQFKGDKHFNALKYVNIYFRYRNIVKGEADGKFLGL